MPVSEIDEHDELIAFRQLRGGAELYERDIEDLLECELVAPGDDVPGNHQRLGGKTLDDLRHVLHDRFTSMDPDA